MKKILAGKCDLARGIDESLSNLVWKLRLIGIVAVCDKAGCGRTSVYTIPDFPKPVKIKGFGAKGGSRWVEHEVDAWVLSRIQLRDAAQGGE